MSQQPIIIIDEDGKIKLGRFLASMEVKYHIKVQARICGNCNRYLGVRLGEETGGIVMTRGRCQYCEIQPKKEEAYHGSIY